MSFLRPPASGAGGRSCSDARPRRRRVGAARQHIGGPRASLPRGCRPGCATASLMWRNALSRSPRTCQAAVDRLRIHHSRMVGYGGLPPLLASDADARVLLGSPRRRSEHMAPTTHTSRRRPASIAANPPPRWPVDPDHRRRMLEIREGIERTRRQLRRNVQPYRKLANDDDRAARRHS
jgi:hypothetical protein